MDDIVAYLRDGTCDQTNYKFVEFTTKLPDSAFSMEFCTKDLVQGSLLRCLRPEKTDYVLKKIHEGICENHSRVRSLVRKAICQGYLWPQMERDAETYTKKCDKCQRFVPVSYLSHTEILPMTSPWPFAQGEIDILGPLSQAPLQRKF